jgi:hypothetical protein
MSPSELVTEKRTFIPADLRQGLSSYRQIAASELLNRDFDSARRLRALVDHWNSERKLADRLVNSLYLLT